MLLAVSVIAASSYIVDQLHADKVVIPYILWPDFM